MDDIQLKVEIFKAVISNGSRSQKENWETTSQEVWKWVSKRDTRKSSPKTQK